MAGKLQRRLSANEVLWWSGYTLIGGLAATAIAAIASHLGSLQNAIGLATAFAGSIFIAVAIRRERTMSKLAKKLEEALHTDDNIIPSKFAVNRLERSVIRSCDRLDDLRHRFSQKHSVTGLETREVLFEKMKSSLKPGLLGIFEIRDYRELLAHNIEIAEKVLKIFATRAVQMAGDRHVIAQIDRASFAIWVNQESNTEAPHEFAAFCYAMSGRLHGADYDLLPQVDSGYIIVGQDCIIGPALLARAISSVSRGGINSATPCSIEDQRLEYALEQDLHQAVERKQFNVQYQPFIDAEFGMVCGAEALLRWQHPERGFLAPGIFFPIVEKAGLAEEIGLWVLDNSIAAAATWQQQGLRGVKVAVNISAHQLLRPNLDIVIGRLMTRHALDFAMLELELTETAAAIDPASANVIFGLLRKKKISISIDDFGAGYSSLSYLKKLSFDKLKIDREFVTNVGSDGRSQAICQSIIALGRGLGISVLAEGVETYEEFAWLRRHGCRYFQGYYFSKPLDLASFVSFSTNRTHIREKVDVGPAALQKRIGVLVA